MFNNKTCTKCHGIKELSAFNKDKYGMLGRTYRCKECIAQARKADNSKRTEYNKKWRQANRDRYNSVLAEWRRANPSTDRALKAKRRASKFNATPSWLTLEQLNQIKNFYTQCPKGYEVDHIVPLQGVNVKGLHVPWNLQYLTKADNCSKSNKF